MKKIGILTFQSTINYGAQLQNYALQEYISNNGENIDTYVINYNNNTVNSIEKKLYLKDQNSIKDFVKYIKNGKSKRNRWYRFEEFRKKYINLTDEYDRDNIKKVDKIIDYYVVGSDQVWNLDITGDDYTYFLDFVKNNHKKYSYAASLGKTKFNMEQSNIMKNLLSDFESVNVREKSAEDFLKGLDLSNVTAVMDPTFLLTKEDWINKFNIKLHNEKQKYILVYMIDNIKENFKKIKKFAKDNNLKIIYITNDFFNIQGVKNVRDASPIEFLNYIYNSQYIITGSFHAICFSLIFNKNFFYILNKSNGRNSRLLDLMKIINIDDNNNITGKSNIEKINLDYILINDNLKNYVANSREKLNSIIKEWRD